MRFYTREHQYYCGVDLHARTLYLCVLDVHGKKRLHKRVRSEPAAFLEAIEPYREGLVVGVECIFCWYWLADLCASEQIPFVLGHALYMKAIHGAKAKNDQIDSHKIAVMLRGGSFPEAYVYPRGMRATRDLLRRRLFFVRKRGELFAHIRNTFHQYNLPRPAGQLLYKKNREGLVEAFDDPLIRSTLEADLALADRYDTVIRALERRIGAEAQVHDPETFERLQTTPGVGKVLALTLLYELHDITRFGSVQRFSSYCRLVKSQHTSDGKRTGSGGGSKIGNAHLESSLGSKRSPTASGPSSSDPSRSAGSTSEPASFSTTTALRRATLVDDLCLLRPLLRSVRFGLHRTGGESQKTLSQFTPQTVTHQG